MRIDSQLCLPFSRAEHPRKPLHPCALCVVSANIPKWQNKNKIFYQTHRSYIVAIVLLKSTWKKSCEICCFSFCTQHASLLLSLLHSLLSIPYRQRGQCASSPTQAETQTKQPCSKTADTLATANLRKWWERATTRRPGRKPSRTRPPLLPHRYVRLACVYARRRPV